MAKPTLYSVCLRALFGVKDLRYSQLRLIFKVLQLTPHTGQAVIDE